MKVLVGIDGGSQQAAALALGAQLAKGGSLIVATVAPWAEMSMRLGSAYALTVQDAAEELLASAKDDIPGIEFEARNVADTSAARGLHHLAEEESADLLVIGACHRGRVGRALLGGTGDRVVHGSPCPVVVAPRDYAGGGAPPERIGVAYDGGAEADAALAWAASLAERAGASLILLMALEPVPVAGYRGVVPSVPNEEMTRHLRAEARHRLDAAIQRLPAGAEGHVLEDGPVIQSLTGAASAVDLLVCGSRDYGPVGTLLMGSVSHALMHEAPCPVVVLPRTAIEHRRESEASVTSAAD